MSEISSEQFTKWQAFARLEPFGFEAANLLMGKTCQTIALYSGNLRPNATVRLADFMLNFDTEPKPMSTENMKAIVRGIQKALGARKPSPVTP